MDMIKVKKRNGDFEDINPSKILVCIERCAIGLNIDTESLMNKVLDECHHGVSTSDINKKIILHSRSYIPYNIDYNYFAARILLENIYKSVFGKSFDSADFFSQYKQAFINYVKHYSSNGILHKELGENFDLEKLANALIIDNDYIYTYTALQNLYDRYLLDFEKRLIETPQFYHMRVAMGVCYNETNATERAIELYERYSSMKLMGSSPVLFNSGTRNNLISCFLSEVDDSVDGIFDNIHQNARKSKHAGGLGFHVTRLRANNSFIRGTRGKSSGLIPWMKLYNDLLLACNQSGKRAGSGCAYIEPWHLEIFDFLELRKNVGDERRRTHDLNLAIWTNDLFLKRCESDQDWTLFDPAEVSDLIDLYGKEFDDRYMYYEYQAKLGNIKLFQTIKAKDLMRKWVDMLFATSSPWMTFKDISNARYSNIHQGTLHGSNLCCVTGDQRVPTQFGLLTVKELVEKSSSLNVVGRTALENTSPMVKTLLNQPVAKVTTKTGLTHKITYDHPLWVVDKGWVEVKDLKVGDKIETQSIEGLWGKEHNPDLAFLVGFLAGDGTFDKSKAYLDLYVPKQKYLPKIKDHATNLSFVFSEYKTKSDFVNRIRLWSKDFDKIILDHKVNKENKTNVPQFIWEGSSETVGLYLQGLYLADGTIQSGKDACTISLCSIHKEFLQDIQLLLKNKNIKSSITFSKRKPNLLPDGNGGSKLYDQKDYYRLVITSIKDCKKFEDWTNLGTLRENNDFLNHLLSREAYNTSTNDVIKSIEFSGVEDVYCLKVLSNSDKAWVCNGVITKNTEILLHSKHSKYDDKYGHKTEVGETAVCCLHPVNLAAHMVQQDGKYVLDWDDLNHTIRVGVRALDNIISINKYLTEETEKSALSHRAIGLGTMGWADVYYMADILQDSEAGSEFAHSVMEKFTYEALLASSNLAAEKGKYSTYEGSLWSKGILPIDTWRKFYEESDYKEIVALTDYPLECDWDSLRETILNQGMRNSNVVAIAPTASTAYLAGVEQSIEPTFKTVTTYENLSGITPIVNSHFFRELQSRGLLTKEIIQKLVLVDGNTEEVTELPEDIKRKYCSVYKRDMRQLVISNANRQKFADQGISFNLWIDTNSKKELVELYMFCWKIGVKTTYYLKQKSLGNPKTRVGNLAEQSTIPVEEKIDEPLTKEMCSILNKDACEMCQ